MRLSLVLPVALIILLSVVQYSTVHSQSPQSITEQGFGLNRSASLTIKIVFIGITATELNSTYLKSSVSLQPLKYQAILAGPLNTGVIFNFNYQLTFADNSTVDKFAQYLSSIQKREDTASRPSSPSGLVNPYFTNSSTLTVAQNYFYDADKVESWLASNMTLFGSNPVSGYTLFVADIHSFGIPSFTYSQYQAYFHCTSCPPPSAIVQAHYYNRTATDPDLGLKMSRHFMTGWGGSGRFYFMDLSAGPSYWTNELPVQVASQLRGISTNTYYGKLWMSKFIGAYVNGAVNNLFAPDQLYPVNYASNYNIQLFVIDNRTSAEQAQRPKLQATINQAGIQQNLASLVPFATVTIGVNYYNVSAFSGLAAVIANATTSLRDPASGRPVVDGDLVYHWFTTSGLGHITNFINVTRTTSKVDIPGFLFAFKGNYTFGVPFKEDIGSTIPSGTFGGEALGDMVLIGFSQTDFTLGNNSTYGQPNKGAGFTHATTHELGHMMGLNHPFIYDLTEDFTNTVMGYYAYSLNFSQFDRDSILRGVNDELLSFALEALSTTPNTLFDSGDISMANQDIVQAENLYNMMDYAGAVNYSLAAAMAASAAQQIANGVPPALVFGLIGVAIGAGIGILLGYLIFKRRKLVAIQYNRCPTCQQPLRWDPAQMRWYCDRCQKPV
jgi:hypothetical protein